MSLSKAYYITPIVTNRLFPASGPSSRTLNNLNIQALLPKAGHNTIVPLANRKPEHFCDLTICLSQRHLCFVFGKSTKCGSYFKRGSV